MTRFYQRYACVFMIAVLTFGGLFINNAVAITLDFQVSAASVDIGDTFTVSAVIGGLGSFTAPSLGAFDFNIDYDSALVALTATPPVFTNLLGDEGLGESFTGSSVSLGSINLFALSFLADLDLNALQPSTFTLATLSFSALSAGIHSRRFLRFLNRPRCCYLVQGPWQ